jgi:hypothetical protein
MARYVFLGFAILSICFLVHLLWTGRVYARGGRLIGTRQTAPGDFWLAVAISIAFFIIGLVTFLYMCFHSIN